MPTYDEHGVSLTIAKKGDSPTIISKFYIMFGKVETVMKIANGAGMVSAAVLLSDDLDEIDWEAVGINPNTIATNTFWHGATPGGSVAANDMASTPGCMTGFHTYTVDWTAQQLLWQVDGVTQVTRTPAQSAGHFPQSPMQVKLGIWAAGDTNPGGL